MSSPNLDHDLGTIEPLPADILEDACRSVARNTTDRDDADVILGALGWIE